jgi:CO/xanthine dehydrogenase FAD-binding subunit
VDVLAPTSLVEALAMRAERPDAAPLAGGTLLVLAWNRGGTRPAAVLDLSRVDELRGCDDARGGVRIGALTTYAELTTLDRCPALAQAAEVIASPQIRNRGTIGGCIAAPEEAGDVVPPLLVEDASVELASVGRTRRVALDAYLAGERARPDELVTAILAHPAGGREAFLKVGRRNAATSAVVSVAVAVDGETAAVACRTPGAPPAAVRGFLADADAIAGRLVDAAELPDDAKASAAYRRHAVRVLTRRGLERCAR